MNRRLCLLTAGALVVASAVTVTMTANAATTCQVTYTVTNQWSGGFQADVSINSTGDPLNGWSLAVGFPDASQKVIQSWNSTSVQSGQKVTFSNAAWNASVRPNAAVSFGFVGTFTGSNPAPTSYTLNGTTCGSPGTATPTGAPTTTSAVPQPTPTTKPPATTVPNPTTTKAPKPGATPVDPPGSGGQAPAHFDTLPPGSALPSGAQCAAWVRAVSIAENKRVNATANQTVGHPLPDARGLLTKVDGNFTGTTGQVLRWAACKWGVDEDLVRAQAAIESWWRIDTLGDWGTDATRCPPGHGLGVDGKAGTCPESYGLLQVRYPYNMSAFPDAANSSAFNADYAYANWRSCFEGQLTWLNSVDRGSDYQAGDAWGCTGVWFSGRWYTSAANGYIARVKDYLAQRIWGTAGFQEP